MRILHVVTGIERPHGWWGDYFANLADQAASDGHQVSIVSTSAPSAAWGARKTTIPQSLSVVQTYLCPLAPAWDRIPIAPIRHFDFAPALVGTLNKQIAEHDVVHIHMIFPFACVLASALSAARHTPYIISPLGNLDPYTSKRSRFFKSALMRFWGRDALRRAAAVHFMSEAERDAVATLRISYNPIVVQLAVDTTKYRQRPDSMEFRRSRPELRRRDVILYVGRLHQTKGLDLLINAFVHVHRARPNAHLVLIGKDDGYEAPLRAMVREAGLTENVTFLAGASDDLKIAALSEANVFVMPSHTEMFGIAILEAMACRLPVVLNRRVGIAAEIETSQAARIAEPSPEALADGLIDVLDDSRLRERLIAAASRLIEDKYSWTAVGEKFLRLYEVAASGKVRLSA